MYRKYQGENPCARAVPRSLPRATQRHCFRRQSRSDALSLHFGSARCTVYPCASHQSSRIALGKASAACLVGWAKVFICHLHQIRVLTFDHALIGQGSTARRNQAFEIWGQQPPRPLNGEAPVGSHVSRYFWVYQYPTKSKHAICVK